LLVPPKIPKNTQDYIDLPISGGKLYSFCWISVKPCKRHFGYKAKIFTFISLFYKQTQACKQKSLKKQENTSLFSYFHSI